jgi:hypothetical protein
MKTMDVQILGCNEKDCIYNKNSQCHTKAITIGSDCACCDTFMKGKNEAGFENVTGIVGACRVSDCMHNESMECQADGIQVAMHSKHPDCVTYKQK